MILLPYFCSAQIGEKNFIDQNYIEVTGKSEMEITPDLIYLKITLSEKDDKNKTSLSFRENQMINKLKAIGVDVTKDLTIADYNSNFKTYFLGNKDVMLTKDYQLIVRDTKMLQKVMTEFEKLSISNVSIIKTDHSKIEDFRREVKIMAVKAAKEKAQAMASAIGQTAGRAIYILENQTAYYNNYTANTVLFKSGSVAESADAEQPEFEKIKLEFSVLCRFELK